jgi:hypothetical protein
VGEPRYRARWAKQIVGACKRAPESARRRLEASIPDDVRNTIRGKGMLDWLAADDFVRLCDAIHDALDPVERDELWARTLQEALQTPLLAPLLAGGLGIFGRTPAALMRMTPQVWSLLARDSGHAEFTRAGQAGRISFVDLPAEVAASRGFAGALHGYTTLTLAWSGHTGRVEMTTTPAAIHVDVRPE